jgi:PIN domain nuclease of toxin-antitoxin system
MTRFLLDTHLVLWWLGDHPQLPKTAVDLILDPDHEVHVSQVSLWELAIKCSVGRLEVDLAKLERAIPAQGFRWLPIRNQHLLAVAKLETSPVHRDPFDRLLVAQSRVEPLRLLTADRQLAAYGPTVTVL